MKKYLENGYIGANKTSSSIVQQHLSFLIDQDCCFASAEFVEFFMGYFHFT